MTSRGLLYSKSYIPTIDLQNNFVPRDHGCFACHTDDLMFGDYRAKWRGVHHLWVQYFGTVLRPADIQLYTPSNNRECLHCHAGARTYEEASHHLKDPNMRALAAANKLSCMSSDYDDIVHDLEALKDATFCKASMGAGLIIQMLTLLWNHPLVFVAFLRIGCPLV